MSKPLLNIRVWIVQQFFWLTGGTGNVESDKKLCASSALFHFTVYFKCTKQLSMTTTNTKKEKNSLDLLQKIHTAVIVPVPDVKFAKMPRGNEREVYFHAAVKDVLDV